MIAVSTNQNRHALRHAGTILWLVLASPMAWSQHVSGHDMSAIMSMDVPRVGTVMLDQVEWRGESLFAWNAQAWYGDERDKLWFKSEGQRESGRTEDARIEALWDHAIGEWWTLQAGLRQDVGTGAQRSWAAVGVAGLAPQWIEVEATLYIGEQGRSAARLKLAYELLLSQRLILQPEVEINLYDRRDVTRGVDAGLSSVEAGLRLRYEIRRQFAPYAGVVLMRTPQLHEVKGVAGLRIWF